jgi:DNA repair exonuclease SbcCD ATPase subunit
LDEQSDIADQVSRLRTQLQGEVAGLSQNISILETISLNSARRNAAQALEDVKLRRSRAEEKLGTARRAANRAKSLHDATRRAAGETLDRRLGKIMPLTAELYQRLRPHPIWDEISYKLRGDVKRFLKLEVGEELNPQFLFSSGQRRATGLAFLLSVNLSISWSRFKSVLLDDPVQHIDDFRSVHLAEVLGKLVESGRQVICAAEDPALADLIARRLPIDQVGEGRRVTLGVDERGHLAKLEDRCVPTLPATSFLSPLEFEAAG